jgi:hypothetical protein
MSGEWCLILRRFPWLRNEGSTGNGSDRVLTHQTTPASQKPPGRYPSLTSLPRQTIHEITRSLEFRSRDLVYFVDSLC